MMEPYEEQGRKRFAEHVHRIVEHDGNAVGGFASRIPFSLPFII